MMIMEKYAINDSWEREKFDIMDVLVIAKFRQNKELYFLLLNTRPFNLIEGTLDIVWGQAVTLDL